MKARKIVITGLGVTSTLGTDVQTFWKNLNSQVCGFARLPMLDQLQVPFNVGGYVEDFTDQNFYREVEPSTFGRATQLALHAASQAVRHARLRRSNVGSDSSRVGVVMGTTCGANDAIEAQGFEANWFSGNLADCPRESFVKYDHCSIANALSREFGFDGPSYVVGTACSSGNHAIGEAMSLIQSGQADIVLCGGSDAFTLLPIFGFYSMKSLAKEQCMPFDRKREGMILGEGAAVLVLENIESAQSRGVSPLAEVRGWALNCDAKNFAAPMESGERCEQLIHACLMEANLDRDDIDYINVHGTGTVSNDLMEARGISLAYEGSLKKVPISSIKGTLGHTLGAAGAFEAVTSTLVIENDRIPPNTPVMEMDDGIDLYVVTESTSRPVQNVLSLSFAFGGCNVATLFSKP